MPAPTATLPLEPPVTVEFTMARLEAIEDATGKTCNDLMLTEFREWVRAGDKDETPEAREGAQKRISVKVARRFLAGVLGCTLDQLECLIQIDQVMDCATAAIGPFVRSMAMLNGGKQAAEPPVEEPKKGPTEPAASPA